jgi:hypothetical protein
MGRVQFRRPRVKCKIELKEIFLEEVKRVKTGFNVVVYI